MARVTMAPKAVTAMVSTMTSAVSSGSGMTASRRVRRLLRKRISLRYIERRK
jgi:hypothetical protein